MKKTLFVIAILGLAVLHLPAPSGGGGISGGGGGVTPGSTNGIWGAIAGSIGDQSDLQAQFGTKAGTNDLVTTSNALATAIAGAIKTNDFVDFTINRQAVVNAAKAYASTNPFTILMMGDSTSYAVQGGADTGLLQAITNKLPLCGAIAYDGGYIGTYPNATASSGFHSVGTTNFPLSSFDLTSGGALTNLQVQNGGYVSFPCDTFRMWYIQQPGAGALQVNYSTNDGASWVNLANISAAGSYRLVATNWSLPLGSYRFVTTCTNGGTMGYVTVWAFNGWDVSGIHGLRMLKYNIGGHKPLEETVNLTGSNASNLLASFNPSLILFESKNDVNSVVQSNIVAFTQLLTNACPNASIVWTTTTQQDPSYPQWRYDVTNNYTIYTNALRFGQMVFDNYGYFGSWSNFNAAGLASDSFHGNGQMGLMKGQAIWSRVSEGFADQRGGSQWVGSADLFGNPGLFSRLAAKPQQTISSNVPADNLLAGLRLWLTCDEGTGTTLFDRSGSAHNATNATAHWTAGIDGGGVLATNISGSDAFVANFPSLGVSNAISVSTWVRSQYAFGGSDLPMFADNFSVDGAFVFGSYPDPTSVRLALICVTNGTPVSWNADNIPCPSWADGGWHNVGFTYDGAVASVFMDGVVLTNYSASGPLKSWARAELKPPYAGATTGAWLQWDDFRLYDRALSTNEMVRLWRSRPVNNDASSAVLSGSFFAGSTGSYQATGLTNYLPAAGTYLVTVNARWLMQLSAGTGYMTTRLYGNGTFIGATDRFLEIDSDTIQHQRASAFTYLVTVTAPTTVELWLGRFDAGGATFSDSQIFSDASGNTTMNSVRLK